MNLFLWNYRGYGRSQGCPKPSLLQQDGELIVDFLRKEYKAQKIGVHGQSLGGLLACHLASKCNLDFLCADRTFSSFSNIVNFSFSSLFAKVFQIISNWSENNASKYTSSKCYKVVTYDPKDEIINVMSSLQTGIVKEAIYSRISEKRDEIEFESKHPNKLKEIFNKMHVFLKTKKKILRDERQLEKDFDSYYETCYFTATEFNSIFNAFVRVMEIIVEMSKYKSTFKKMHRRFLSNDDGKIEKMRNKAKDQEPGVLSAGNTGSLDSSLNVTSTNISVLNISHFKEESNINPNEISVNKSVLKDDNNNSVLINNNEEDADENNRYKSDMKVPIGESTEYLDLLTDKEKNSEKFQSFILEVDN